MPNGMPKEGPPPGVITPEDERARRDREIAFQLPIDGEDLIKELKEVELEQLSALVEESLAFREGLPFGVDGYNLNNPETLLGLQTLFSSSEGMRERPSPYYVDTAIKERIRKEIRRIKKGARGGKITKEEEGTIAQLERLENHREGRKLIDAAFVQRTTVCEQAEAVSELLGPAYAKPDKGHWQGALWGEFGEKVDAVLRKIVEVGETTPIYAKGFEDEKTFREWLAPLVKIAGGRMDIVWFAWRLALLWELPVQFGAKVKIENGRKTYKIADPPIGNDLFTWTAHLEKKRMIEWGVDVNYERMPDTGEKFLTHTGYPLSIGRIGPLCESFLHESKVYWEEEKREISLWELWWDKKMKIGGDFDNDPNTLPWSLTEMQHRGLDTEEFGTGSFGLWRLRAARSAKVVEDIRSRPSLRDLSDPDFFASRLRNWFKVVKVKVKPELPSEKNPRAWWVAGLIMAHHLEADKKIPLVQGKPEIAYRTYSARETWSIEVKGQMETRTTPIWEILNHAYQCGFLRRVDIDWLVTNLGIPKPMGGAKAY